jgi:YD repeat-containing protein
VTSVIEGEPSLGGTGLRETQTIYEDSNLRVITRRDVNNVGDAQNVSVTEYDQLGRVCLTRQLEPATGTIPTQSDWDNDSEGIKVQTQYRWGTGARYQVVSNPYRNSSTDATMGWLLTTFDSDGRPIGSTHYSGSAQPSPWGSNSSTTGSTSTSYAAQVTTVTDEASNSRQSTVDGLGRLTGVVEDPGTPVCSATQPQPCHYNYATSYAYDVNDNLTGVTQGALSRSFVYDSLKRLSSAQNPENGTISYTYDADGNLLSKADAVRTACFGTWTGSVCSQTPKPGYDALDRTVLKSFSDSSPNTPQVTWTWDTGVGKGNLASVISSASTTSFSNYDNLHRPGSSSQTTPTGQTTYTFSYVYQPSGLQKVTYPGTQRAITYSYDGAGRQYGASGSYSSQTTNYAASVAYAPHNAISGFSLNNGNNYEETCYNARLQPVGIRLGAATTNGACTNPGGTSSDALNLALGYSASANNGNLLSQGITRYIAGSNQSWTQSYSSYDGVNRLTAAAETGGSSEWGQTYSYDQWGNRAVTGSSTIPNPYATPTALTQYTNNRWLGTGASYDGVGNQ